ncbi:MAG: site-specific integrase [Arcobacteraceae bacterium]|nr:site-specific integrase [Arcobacteraceae bacterium]
MDMEAIDIIKSVKVSNKEGNITLDIIVKSTAKLPIGKKGYRFRHNIGKYTAVMFKYTEKNKFKIAYEYYQSKFDDIENKEVILFEDVAFLALKEAEINRRKIDDTKNYLSILKKHVLPYFGKMPLKDIKVKDVKAWIVEQGKLDISQSTFNKRHYVIKRVLDYSNENEYTSSNIIQHVKRSSPLFRKRQSNDDAFYTQDEVDLILNDTYEGSNINELRNHNFINTFCHIGILIGARTGEISALKFSDINWEERTIKIQRSITKSIIDSTKTGVSRTVPMVEKLYQRLLKHKESAICDWIFPNPITLMPYTDSRTISDHKFKSMLKRLNIPYKGLYQLRHTFTTLAILNGVLLPTVSKCLGHRGGTAVTQKHYLRLGNTNQKDMREQLEKLTV